MPDAIYLDNMATTPVDPVVLEAMLPFFTEKFGNAASRDHDFGRAGRDAVEEARAQIAALIHASPEEIVFTSGATESDNLALKGVVDAVGESHVITAPTEHKAILDTCRFLKSRGCGGATLPVDRHGLVDPEDLRQALADSARSTVLVSIMLANNEIGVIQPVEELAKVARERGALFHTDAAQAVGKIPVDVDALGVDLLSLTAHKIYGPKGIGALYVRRSSSRSPLSAQMHGGGHEQDMRSGTLNVPGIVGLGKACEVAGALLEQESARLTSLREKLYEGLIQELLGITINGHPSQRLPGNLNLCFHTVDGSAILECAREIALSAGAACTSASVEPSYVLKALGLSDREARSSLRFGIGRFNTAEEIDSATARIVQIVKRLRELSPLWEEI